MTYDPTLGQRVDVSDRSARLVGVVDTELPVAAAISDTDPNPTVPSIAAKAQLYNEATGQWERAQGNSQDTVLLATAARTGGAVTPVQTNRNARGAVLMFRAALGTGSGTAAVYLREESASPIGGWEGMTPQTYVLIVYPGASTAAGQIIGGGKMPLSVPLPRRWYAEVVKSDGSSWTYGLTYYLIV